MTGRADWPQVLTPELREILGFVCFQLAKFAHAYRDAGEFVDASGKPLPHRAEDEQAFMLHKFLTFWWVNGADWKTAAEADLQRILGILRMRAANADATNPGAAPVHDRKEMEAILDVYKAALGID